MDVKKDVKPMKYRHFLLLIPLFIFVSTAIATPILEECIAEPVFNGSVCVYQTNREAEKTVLLIHGIGDNASRDWQQQIAVLAREFHVVTLDLPGFGRSAQGDKDYSPEQYVALIEFVATHYAIPRFDLVGHSMGAAIALLYTAKFPERVRRLVMVDAAGILHRLAIGKYVIAGAINNDVSNTNTAESYVVKVIEKFEQLFSIFRNDAAEKSEHLRAGIELVDYNFGAALDSVDKPTLIIWGENDRIAPLRTAMVINYRISHSRLEIIAGAGHLSMVEKSDRFNQVLMGFLQATETTNTVGTKSAEPPKRSAKCNNKRQATFSGRYKRVEINNCSSVTIKDADISELYLFESRVTVDGSRIGSDVAVALESIGSDVKVTASTLTGNTTLKVARSRLDLAAVDIFSKGPWLEALSGSRLICSVCRHFNASGKIHLHDHFVLDAGNTL